MWSKKNIFVEEATKEDQERYIIGIESGLSMKHTVSSSIHKIQCGTKTGSNIRSHEQKPGKTQVSSR